MTVLQSVPIDYNNDFTVSPLEHAHIKINQNLCVIKIATMLAYPYIKLFQSILQLYFKTGEKRAAY